MMPIHKRVYLATSGNRYLCNQACNIDLNKCVDEYNKVTCKNCKRALDLLRKSNENFKKLE